MGGAACAAHMWCESIHRHLLWALGSPTAVHFGCLDQLTESVPVQVDEMSIVSVGQLEYLTCCLKLLIDTYNGHWEALKPFNF